MTLHERFDTRINLQNLLAALAIAGGLVAWAMRMDGRLTALETAQKAQADVDRRQDAERDRTQETVTSQLRRMEDKLDRLVERESRRGSTR